MVKKMLGMWLFMISNLISYDTLTFYVGSDKLTLLPSDGEKYSIEKGKEYVIVQKIDSKVRFHIGPKSTTFDRFEGTFISPESSEKIETVIKIPEKKYVGIHLFPNTEVYIQGLHLEKVSCQGKLFKVLRIEKSNFSLEVKGWGANIQLEEHQGNVNFETGAGGGNIFIEDLKGNVFFQPYAVDTVHFKQVTGDIQGKLRASYIYVEHGNGAISLETGIKTSFEVKDWEGAVKISPQK